MEQRHEIRFLPRTEKREYRASLLKRLPLLYVMAEAIALFSPLIGVHSLACPQERSPQFNFLGLDFG